MHFLTLYRTHIECPLLQQGYKLKVLKIDVCLNHVEIISLSKKISGFLTKSLVQSTKSSEIEGNKLLQFRVGVATQ